MKKRPLIPTFSLNTPLASLLKKSKVRYKLDLGTKEDIEIYKRRMSQKEK